MSASAAQVLLAALQAAGGACEIVCPACKAIVDLGEELAKLALADTSTEAQQESQAEATILAADAAAVQGLQAAHVAPSAPVQAAGAIAGAALSAVAQVEAPAPPPGTVASWQK